MMKNDLDIIKEFKEKKKLQERLKAKFSEFVDSELAFKIKEHSETILELLDELKDIPEDWVDNVRKKFFFDMIFYNERYLHFTNEKLYPHDYIEFIQRVHKFFYEYNYEIPSDSMIDIWKKEITDKKDYKVVLMLKYIQKAIDLIAEDKEFTKLKYVRYDIMGNLSLEQYFISLKYGFKNEKKFLEKANEYFEKAEDFYEYTSEPVRTMKYLIAFINYLVRELNIINIYDFKRKIYILREVFPEFSKK